MGEMMWFDMRWREQGWREAFRARLSGWLPEDWRKAGIQHGVLKRSEMGEGIVTLTDKGWRLTDQTSSKVTDDSLQGLALMMVTLGFERRWLDQKPAKGHARLPQEAMFEPAQAQKIRSFFEAELDLHPHV